MNSEGDNLDPSGQDAGADDSRVRLDISSCSLSPFQVAGHPSSNVGRQERSRNLEYQYVMSHCIKVNCQVYGHIHCTEWWFPLVEACLDVCCELEDVSFSVHLASSAVTPVRSVHKSMGGNLDAVKEMMRVSVIDGE